MTQLRRAVSSRQGIVSLCAPAPPQSWVGVRQPSRPYRTGFRMFSSVVKRPREVADDARLHFNDPGAGSIEETPVVRDRDKGSPEPRQCVLQRLD